MRKQKSFLLVIFAAAIMACVQAAALGQGANDGNLANVTAGGSSVRWDVVAQHAGGTVTISTPDGRTFYREFKAGAAPEINISDKQFDGLGDGTYSYELRLKPALSAGAREAMKAARGKDDDAESERAGRKRPASPALVQSGAFTILNGVVVVGGASEGQQTKASSTAPKRTPGVISGNTVTRLRNHRVSLGAMPDDVIPDDLIVQGSACVGLDCVSGEVFGFDTVRLKENNTRLQFEDTSASGFPLNNWQIRANSSAAGGASFLAFVDQGAAGNSETGTIVFEVDAGAPANALKVASSGRVGLRTATPSLDLHITTGDTPAHRLEQTNASGFTAQTWDIAGNEANFFIRDVTGGSRLPFRIRPGAPTSSIDISASGNVGIGTTAPTQLLQINSAAATQSALAVSVNNTTHGIWGIAGSTDNLIVGSVLGDSAFRSQAKNILFSTDSGSSAQLYLKNGGRVGIGTTAPDQVFSVNGDASKTGGGSWQTFSDERLKTIKGRFNSGLSAVMQLQPIRYEYKSNNALGLKSEGDHIGFGAQSLQKIIPEAVTKNSEGYLLVNNDPILWTMLNAIKEQQKEIVELKEQVQKLRAASHRRRK